MRAPDYAAYVVQLPFDSFLLGRVGSTFLPNSHCLAFSPVICLVSLPTYFTFALKD